MSGTRSLGFALGHGEADAAAEPTTTDLGCV